MSNSRLINGVMSCRPKNYAEGWCYDELSRKGYVLTKRGWADFFCFKDDEIMCVEVKPTIKHNLKREQHKVMKALSERGIPCFVWTPETKLISYNDYLNIKLNSK